MYGAKAALERGEEVVKELHQKPVLGVARFVDSKSLKVSIEGVNVELPALATAPLIDSDRYFRLGGASYFSERKAHSCARYDFLFSTTRLEIPAPATISCSARRGGRYVPAKGAIL